jgi:hypothetical protein
MREYLRVATTSFDVFDDCDHALREIQTDLAQVTDERAHRYHRTPMQLPLGWPFPGRANIETIILPKGRCRLPSNTKRRFASRRFAREVGQID